MFQVKQMRAEDFMFAAELSNTMNWNMAPEDFQYMTTLEADGCFLLTDGSERIGIATCISYGMVGWFGNLIIKEKYRHKGAGSVLVRHAIDYLHSKGVETIGLYAYPNLTKFYGDLGFKAEEQFAVLHAKTATVPIAEELPQIEKKNIDSIVKFDCECFGWDRRRLLESIILDGGNLGYFLHEGGTVVGYAAAKVYDAAAEVGPLICQSNRVDAAMALVAAVVSKLADSEVYVWGLPKKEITLAHTLSKFGFREDFSVTRMFLGISMPKNCLYIAESLERG